MIAHLPIAACVVRDGLVVEVNAKLLELTGWRAEDFLDAHDPFGKFLAAEDVRRVLERYRARVAGHPAPDTYDFTGRRADGSLIPARVRASPFPPAGERAVLLVFTESELSRAAAVIRGFVEIAVEAQREESAAGILRVIRQKIAALGFVPAIMEVRGTQYRPVGDEAEIDAWAREIRARWPGWKPMFVPIDFEKADQGLFLDDLRGVMSKALGRPVEEGPTTAALASVRVGGEVRYLLACSGNELDSTIAGALGLVAKHAGAALENVARLDELRQRNRELAALNQVAQASATLGYGGALQAAIEELVGALHVDGAALFRADEGVLRLGAQIGFGEEWVRAAREVPIDAETPWGEAAATAEAVLFEIDEDGQVAARGRRISTPPDGTPPGGSLLEKANCIALPLRVGNETHGVLVAARAEPLGRADLRLVATVAAQVAISLQNAALLEQTRRRVEELSLLLELGQEVVGALDLQQVLDAGARVAARVLRCSSAYVFLPEPDGASLRVAAAEDLAMPQAVSKGMRLPLHRGSLSALAFHTKRPHSSSKSASDARIDSEFSRMFQCRATLAVPLVSHGKSLGVLALIERTERVFSSQDIRLATHAAQLVAAALDSAELYEAQRRRADEMARLNAELARTQRELIARERLAALGELSASIAHEVRNPLGVIFNSLGSLRRLLKPEGDVSLLLDIVGEEADRLNRMVGDLLDYSRPLQPALQPMSLRALVEESLASARQQAGVSEELVPHQIALNGVESVRADGRLLRQALVNLFLNALQAMPRGGKLFVEAAHAKLGDEPAAQLSIRDTGPGIPADTLARIWQPFFTTKATGTGLGLAVVKRIVEGHGGEVEVSDSTPGAEFRLRLPLDG